jgi:hypothetical protein
MPSRLPAGRRRYGQALREQPCSTAALDRSFYNFGLSLIRLDEEFVLRDTHSIARLAPLATHEEFQAGAHSLHQA